jgi:hypothetical protein
VACSCHTQRQQQTRKHSFRETLLEWSMLQARYGCAPPQSKVLLCLCSTVLVRIATRMQNLYCDATPSTYTMLHQ